MWIDNTITVVVPYFCVTYGCLKAYLCYGHLRDFIRRVLKFEVSQVSQRAYSIMSFCVEGGYPLKVSTGPCHPRISLPIQGRLPALRRTSPHTKEGLISAPLGSRPANPLLCLCDMDLGGSGFPILPTRHEYLLVPASITIS